MATKDVPAPVPVTGWLKPDAINAERREAEKDIAAKLFRLLVHDTVVREAARSNRLHEPLAVMIYNDRLELTLEIYESIADAKLADTFLLWAQKLDIIQEG